RLASASAGDRVVKVWDAAAGPATPPLGRHADKVFAVACGPGGRWLASAGGDLAVKVWDAAGRELRTLPGHGPSPSALAVSRAGRSGPCPPGDPRSTAWPSARTAGCWPPPARTG